MDKKTVLIVFGGQSSEHEVSLRSANTIISNINNEKYYVLTVGITKKGEWMLYSGSPENLLPGEWEKYAAPAVISPDATHKGILKLVGNMFKIIPIDIVFPVLHGKFGEDGTIQGLFELAQIPYVGAGVMSSAVSMDKAVTKLIAENAGINQAAYIAGQPVGEEAIAAFANQVESTIGYPCFVKPANAGSSVGVTKAKDRHGLLKAIDTALGEDRKIIVEEAVVGRELECAVLGNDEVLASGVGEIFAGADFYDYDAKYNSNDSKTAVSAELEPSVRDEIRETAIKLYQAVSCKGLARVDFFLEKDTNKVIFNEINTLPGFTSISMYPLLWQQEGVPIKKLIDDLIACACTTM